VSARGDPGDHQLDERVDEGVVERRLLEQAAVQQAADERGEHHRGVDAVAPFAAVHGAGDEADDGQGGALGEPRAGEGADVRRDGPREDGAREGAVFIRDHIIRVAERSFDDFAGGGVDAKANRKMLGIK